MTIDESLLDAIDEWRNCREAGEEVSPEELCPNWPAERLLELRNAIDALKRVDDPLPQDGSVAQDAVTLLRPDSDDGSMDVIIAGRYRLIRKLGAGAFGEVYVGWDERLGREVAVKVEKQKSADVSQSHRNVEARKTFHEAWTVAQIGDHPNIVPVHDVGLHDGRCFTVSKYIKGGNLADTIAALDAKNPPELPDIIRSVSILVDIANALHASHNAGFVHRDIKPANILVDESGNPHVVDFGLALHEDEQWSSRGQFAGSLPYMSPEQIRGRAQHLDGRSDIWSLGVVLYELLTGGRRPFKGEQDELLDAIKNRDPNSPRKHNDQIPADLEEITMKCLRKDIAQRYPLAADFAESLRVWIDDQRFTTSHADEMSKVLQRTAESSKVWAVPYDPSPCFTGRDNYLKQIAEHLDAGNYVALSGLGGIGKTQIALEYARHNRERYKYVFWVNAATKQGLVTGFAAIAERLTLPDAQDQNQTTIIAAVKRWLEIHDQWLLIFDNADDLTTLQDFVPRGTNGHVLLTTRAQATSLIATRIDVVPLSSNEGARLLLSRAGLLNEALPEDFASALQICEELGGLPLALDQAGAYIESAESTPSEFLKLYGSHGHALRAERGQSSTDYPQSVATTWAIAFEIIERANPAAADLLRLIAFLAPDGIPEELVVRGAAHLGDHLGAAGRDQYKLNKVFQILSSFSLLRRNRRDYSLTVHRLVQLVERDRMDDITRRIWAERAVVVTNMAFPDVEYGRWSDCERLIVQARAVANIVDEFHLDTMEAGRLLHQASVYLKERGSYEDAASLSKKSLLIREKAAGKDSLEVAETLILLGELHRLQANYPDAEAFFRTAIAILALVSDGYTSETGDALSGLAELYEEMGRHTESEKLYKEAIAIKTQCHGRHHPSVALSLFGLAWLYRQQARYSDAEALLEDVLGITEVTHGNQHPLVGRALNNLAVVAANQGKYSRAEELYQRSLAIDEREFGSRHPLVARSLNNLATLYHIQGSFGRAEELYQRSLKIKRDSYGDGHASFALGLSNLVDLYVEQGRYTEALPLAERALAIRESVFGKQHRYISWSLLTLGLVYCRLGRVAEGEDLASRGLTIIEGMAQPQYTGLEGVLCALALWYSEQGEVNKADMLFCRALTSYQRRLPANDPRIIMRRQQYVDLLRRLGRHDEADELCV